MEPDTCCLPLPKRLLRFAIGLTLLGGFAALIMTGLTPPGVAGEVVRHNRTMHIDASPLFYSEVEHMSELEQGVRLLRERAHP